MDSGLESLGSDKKGDEDIDDDETERLLLEELARRERETTTTSSSSLLLSASGANKVVSATFSAFNETLNTILDTKREQEEEDKFWESVPVLPLEEGEEDERDVTDGFGKKREDVLLYTGEDDAYINHHRPKEKYKPREENVLLPEEQNEFDEDVRKNHTNNHQNVTGGGSFVSDLLVNTYKQAQEAEEALERSKRERVLNELDNWTTTSTSTTASAKTNTVLNFDDIDDNWDEGNNNNNNNNSNNTSAAVINADVRVGLTERYSSYLAKVLPARSTKGRSSKTNKGVIDDDDDSDDDDDDDDDDKRFEKIKNTFMSDEAQRELDKLEASFTPQRKSKKSFFRDFLLFGNGSKNKSTITTSSNQGELLSDDPALLAAVSKEKSKIDKVLNDLKTDMAIKNLANVARNTGGGRLNSFADSLDALAKHPMWEYEIVRYAAMIVLLALFTFGIYLKISIESREEVGGLIDVGIQKSSAGRKNS